MRPSEFLLLVSPQQAGIPVPAVDIERPDMRRRRRAMVG